MTRRLMTRRLPALFVALSLTGALALLAPTHAWAQGQQGSASGGLTVPIVGTVQGFDAPVSGLFTIERFQRNQEGQIEAVGTAVFSFVDPLTGEFRTIVQQLIRLVTAFNDPADTAACPILFLHLAGLELDLLGLVIELDQVTLEIRAEPGPGQLLGNLLCAIAGLLDGPGPVQQLVSLLNRLLGILG